MTELSKVLELSVEDLKLRRIQLENELRKTVETIIATKLKDELNEKLTEFGVEGVTSITWEFYYESDDEGGVDPYLGYLTLHTADDTIDAEEVVINRKSTWSDNFYDYSLGEDLSELFYNYKEDLHKYEIEEIHLV